MVEHSRTGSRKITEKIVTTLRSPATVAEMKEVFGDRVEPASIFGKMAWDLEGYERVAKDRLAAAGYPDDIRKSYEKQEGKWVSVRDGIGLPKLLELDGHPSDSPLGYAAAVLELCMILAGNIEGVVRHSISLGKLVMQEYLDARFGETIEKAITAREGRQQAGRDSEPNLERKREAEDRAAAVKARWNEMQKSPGSYPNPVSQLVTEFKYDRRTINRYLGR